MIKLIFFVCSILKHKLNTDILDLFFYLGFLSRPFTTHRTAREGGENFFNYSLPLPPASQTFRH